MDWATGVGGNDLETENHGELRKLQGGDGTNGMARRRQWSPEEKFKIVVQSLTGDEPNTSLCRRYHISEPTLYNWRQQFFEGAKLYLESPKKRELKTLKEENERLKKTVAELWLACRSLEAKKEQEGK